MGFPWLLREQKENSACTRGLRTGGRKAGRPPDPLRVCLDLTVSRGAADWHSSVPDVSTGPQGPCCTVFP